MQFTVTYDGGDWIFEVLSTGDEPSHIERIEVDDIEDAIETAEELLRQIRADSDPIADLFDEEY